MKVYHADEFTDKGVYIFGNTSSGCDTLHTHNFTELVYIARGRCEQTVGAHSFVAQEGDAILIEEGQTHAFRSLSEDFSYVNLILSRAFLALHASDPLFCRPPGAEIALATLEGGERVLFESLLDGIAAESLGDRYAASSAIGGMVRALLSLLYRRLYAREGGEAVGRLAPLLAQIEGRLGEELTLSLLASQAGYDEAYFSRLFKREIGKSPMAYVTERRVLRAVALLSGTNLPVSEIGIRCGFANRSVMARAFLRVIGKSPTSVRAEKRN